MTDLVKSGAGVPAVTQAAKGFSGDATDILLPRIYAAQKTSKAVDDGVAQFGNILRSTTGEILGGLGKPVKFIPLAQWKSSMITSGGKYVRVEPWKLGSNDLPYEFEENGKPMKRERVLNFYVLLPSDVEGHMAVRKIFEETGEMPDELASLVPCHLSFKSTSYKAGRTLVGHFAQMDELGAYPYNRWLTLDSELVANDKGKFAVLKVGAGGGLRDKDQLNVCRKWASLMQKANVKIDDAGMDEEVVEPETFDF